MHRDYRLRSSWSPMARPSTHSAFFGLVLLCCLVWPTIPGFCHTAGDVPPDMGVDEHLGGKIPLDLDLSR